MTVTRVLGPCLMCKHSASEHVLEGSDAMTDCFPCERDGCQCIDYWPTYTTPSSDYQNREEE